VGYNVLLQKPLYLLIDMATADTDCSGNVGDPGRGIQEVEVLERRKGQ
jgi:hypothetical protein